jgi:hypothetical protein
VAAVVVWLAESMVVVGHDRCIGFIGQAVGLGE